MKIKLLLEIIDTKYIGRFFIKKNIKIKMKKCQNGNSSESTLKICSHQITICIKIQKHQNIEVLLLIRTMTKNCQI